MTVFGKLLMAGVLLGTLPALAAGDATAPAAPVSVPAAQPAAPALQRQAAVAMMPVNAPPAMAPSVLSSVTNPPAKIAGAQVMDEKGKVIGAVQRVETSPQGRPTKVDVTLARTNRIVGFDATAVSYDEGTNQLVTSDQMASTQG